MFPGSPDDTAAETDCPAAGLQHADFAKLDRTQLEPSVDAGRTSGGYTGAYGSGSRSQHVFPETHVSYPVGPDPPTLLRLLV